MHGWGEQRGHNPCHVFAACPGSCAAGPSGTAWSAGPGAGRVLTLADGLGGGPPVVISVGQRLAVDLPGKMYLLQIHSTGMLQLAGTSGGYRPGKTLLHADLLAVARAGRSCRPTATEGAGTARTPGNVRWEKSTGRSRAVVVQR
jgi:hypothetical protein